MMNLPTQKFQRLEPYHGKYDYAYPTTDDGRELDLQPGSELHESLVKEILDRARESSDAMSSKHDKWTELEKTMSLYVDHTDAEKRIKEKDPRKPIPIVIPVGFAMVETNMAFFIKSFLDSPPVHPLDPAGPEDTLGAILLEMLLDWQTRRFKNDLAHYKVFRDNQVYGFGVGVPRWRQEHGWRGGVPTEADRILQFFDPDHRPPDEWGVLAEGNEVSPVDPRLYWPDPNVPIDQPQKAEFLSWGEETQVMSLLEQEGGGSGLFNCKYLQHIDARSVLFEKNRDITHVLETGDDSTGDKNTQPAHVIWQYITLIPKRWGLGNSEYPEKWLFGLSGDTVIIQGRRQGLRHNRYPVAIMATETNGRDVTPLSRLELAQGLQQYIDWMMATYMEALRIDGNGRFFIDPSMVNMHDMADTSRRFVRARRGQFGKGRLGDAVQQFSTSSAAAQNIPNITVLMQFLKETTGAVDMTQGILRQKSGDVSATEAQGSQAGAMTKMERMAWMASRQYFSDMGYLMAVQTQQLMSRGTYAKIVGGRELQLANEYGIVGPSVYAGPLDIQVQFDTQIRDSSIPGGDNMQSWVQLFQIVQGDPELRTQIEFPRLFLHLARTLGAKNVQQFLRNGGMFVPTVGDPAAMEGDLQPVGSVA